MIVRNVVFNDDRDHILGMFKSWLYTLNITHSWKMDEDFEFSFCFFSLLNVEKEEKGLWNLLNHSHPIYFKQIDCMIGTAEVRRYSRNVNQWTEIDNKKPNLKFWIKYGYNQFAQTFYFDPISFSCTRSAVDRCW